MGDIVAHGAVRPLAGMDVTAPGWLMLLVVLLIGFGIGYLMGRKRNKA